MSSSRRSLDPDDASNGLVAHEWKTWKFEKVCRYAVVAQNELRISAKAVPMTAEARGLSQMLTLM